MILCGMPYGGNGSSNTLISRFWLCFSEHSSHTYLYFIHSSTSPQLRRLQTRYFWIWAKLGYIDVLGMLIKQVMWWKSLPFNFFFLHLEKIKMISCGMPYGGNGCSNTLISWFWLCFSEQSLHTYLCFIQSLYISIEGQT